MRLIILMILAKYSISFAFLGDSALFVLTSIARQGC